MIIEYNGITYTIPKEEYEPDNIYLQRLWFVAKQQPFDEKSYLEAVHNSKLWKNIKFLNCKYDQEILKKINDIEKTFVIY